ncbi:arylesterase [Alysiella filiformis]|uniref:Lysophospholipase L1 n=1 Tax=Alysiella filiformis DSM 16848 TaxID=1120981 RepID=A0A286EEG7_9NEIS|nr:arylesterase [Alysiella filiformis]QMT31615.1 arylesterase [Alysiella filiformis]UBQ55374.1 arylesterase [Alysiella filiformis DSM 16848]SOD69259.1 Lysophospholipase L1 [Alysiella filiformis DSM 16848]
MLNRRQFLCHIGALTLLAACGGNSKKYAKLGSGSTVLALGDSLTAGYGASKGADYPNQLAQITGWNVVNGGISGDTCEQALSRLPNLMAQHNPKLVLVSIGGNDFLRKLPESTTRNNITQIIKHIQAAKVPVVLVAIPYFTAGALIGMVSEHELYDDLAKQHQIPLLKGVWADVLGDKSMKSDQIHGNDAGYRYFAEKMADFLKKQGLR